MQALLFELLCVCFDGIGVIDAWLCWWYDCLLIAVRCLIACLVSLRESGAPILMNSYIQGRCDMNEGPLDVMRCSDLG